ncbi:hypothetical protein Mterra_03157 [Calidithermus terrae]|uniref:Uncharacterized protein n=1 Tax=Calidithermus terrae TaxID=1408545 RepID=A0A399EE57_9DEIN|nr:MULTISPECIES: hypothetical protein [Calidithermus]RIH81449.1 hypothetical protein Mterra_03157 [Calidithermus terrae]
MGKKRREEKLRRKTNQRPPLTLKEAFKFFPGLFLRTFLVLTPVTLAMVLLASLGLTFFNNFFVQIAVYLGVYFAFQRFIMGPLYRRPTPRSK